MENLELIPNETVVNDFVFVKSYPHFDLWNYKGLYNIGFHKGELPGKLNKEGDIINESTKQSSDDIN